MYKDIDLLEIHGRNPQKYAQKIVDTLFQREELINTVFIDEGSTINSNRKRCDNARLQIIKSKYSAF